MRRGHLHQIDLNLLKALDLLLTERSVTRAAERLGLTQSGMSHMLARLRATFADPLFVRVPDGLQPTPRALALAAPLAKALSELERVIAPVDSFDPALSRHHFSIATDDYLGHILMPKVLSGLWKAAPGVDISIRRISDRPAADLIDGDLDAIISVGGALGNLPGAYSMKLFDERFVCVLRSDHPLAAKPLDLDLFTSLPHALVAPRGFAGSVVDRALDRIGKCRRVALTIPHFLAAPSIVRETDLVLTIGERLARSLSHGLTIVEPPVMLPGFSVVLIWHERQHIDPAHRWLRSVIAEVARSI